MLISRDEPRFQCCLSAVLNKTIIQFSFFIAAAVFSQRSVKVMKSLKVRKLSVNDFHAVGCQIEGVVPLADAHGCVSAGAVCFGSICVCLSQDCIRHATSGSLCSLRFVSLALLNDF